VNYIMRSLKIVLLNKYLSDQIKKNMMGGACDTCWGEVMCIQDFGGET